MVRSTGEKKINCAVFISGRGSNLKSIFKYSKQKYSKINLKLVISNKSNAKGIKFANKKKIKTVIIDYKNKKSAERKIINILKENYIKFICLAGFMKILSKNLIDRFKNKIINIHPSLLPKYKGLNTHKRAIKNNDKYSGCTVHYVTENLDSGKMIMQKKVKILKSDNAKSLAKRVLKAENEIYPKAINLILSKI